MSAIDFVFAGDLVLDEPQPDEWLAGIAPALHAADVAIGHLEVPHTHHAASMRSDVPAPGADPAHVPAIAHAGFDAVSLAGNHIADCGPVGIADTIAALDAAGVAHSGAGMDLASARRPCLIERGVIGRDPQRIALLSYNCVGPEAAWASATQAGCAYVRIDTEDGSPVRPTAPLRSANPQSLKEMCDDIVRASAQHTLVIVALHKGIVHTPAVLAPYERAVAHAAIDAGADIVIAHHAHIVRGIERYRGKPIFHGLGNGCVVTRALSPQSDDPARAAWARKREVLFGFTPDPDYFLAPFHPHAVNAMLGRVQLLEDGSLRCGFVPVRVDPPGRPRVAGAQEAPGIVTYIEEITFAGGLPPIATDFDGECAWIR
jgi:poly-gamma-glutamate synthesis protein (capsule biosynthesis protein)